jgi:SAM-dependent methyltransferase
MSASNDSSRHPASFRDPCGFVFRHEGVFYRAILPEGLEDYEMLMQSGLYARLRQEGLMIAHEEMQDASLQPEASKILKPAQLDFWSYPYEWSFRQLQAAALLTLRLVALGLEQGMMLKDASACNIQFIGCEPVLIDSLSFERYEAGKPWQAFGQFCRHFLYPLLVFQKCPELSPALLTAYPDGLPAQLTASLLPRKSRLSWNNQLYVFLAAALAKRQDKPQRAIRISKQKILQNVAQLEGYIKSLKPRAQQTAWSNYYEETILSNEYLGSKKTMVAGLLQSLQLQRVIDAGCNTGSFSLMAAKHAQEVIAFDSDPASADALFQEAARRKLTNLHVLAADLTNPTPSLGWANTERSSLLQRLRGDPVLALALVHHLAIGKNIPLSFISALFAGMTTQWLLIEFVPKHDPRTQLLLQARKDIFHNYTEAAFEAAFGQHFHIEKRMALPHSERVLYLMKRA